MGALPADTCLHGSAELLAYSPIPSRRQADPPTHAPLLCTLCCAGHPLVRFMGMSSTGNSDPSLAYVQNLKAVDGDCNSCAFVPAVDNTATFELNLVRVWGSGGKEPEWGARHGALGGGVTWCCAKVHAVPLVLCCADNFCPSHSPHPLRPPLQESVTKLKGVQLLSTSDNSTYTIRVGKDGSNNFMNNPICAQVGRWWSGWPVAHWLGAERELAGWRQALSQCGQLVLLSQPPVLTVTIPQAPTHPHLVSHNLVSLPPRPPAERGRPRQHSHHCALRGRGLLPHRLLLCLQRQRRQHDPLRRVPHRRRVRPRPCCAQHQQRRQRARPLHCGHPRRGHPAQGGPEPGDRGV